MMAFELNNIKSIKVEDGKLIFEWDVEDGIPVSTMAFHINNIGMIGINPKTKTKEDNDDC